VGEDEIKKSLYKWKNMKNGLQGEASLDELVDLIRKSNVNN